MNYDNKMTESNPNAINAMFLSNHDQVRSGNALESQGLSSQKLAAAVYMLAPGNPFIYYGEEIGIKAPNTTNDAAYRTQMVFDSDNLPDIYVNGIGEEAEVPTGGGVKQQLADKDLPQLLSQNYHNQKSEPRNCKGQNCRHTGL